VLANLKITPPRTHPRSGSPGAASPGAGASTR
jgi:hypothetical protein